MLDYSGMYVATLTPFDVLERLDTGVVRAHTQFLVEAGVAGVCPAGTTGEFLYLTLEEKKILHKETVLAARSKIRVIAGIGAVDLSEIAKTAQSCRATGANAVFLPPPFYYPTSQEAIRRFYAHIYEVSGRSPLFAYNIPAYAGNEIGIECLRHLAEDGHIVGVKDSTGKREWMTALHDALGEKIKIFGASDAFTAEARDLGAHGFISALANIFPRTFVQVWQGDDTLLPMIASLRDVVKQNGGIPALKYLLARRGFGTAVTRFWFAEAVDDAALDRAYDAARDAGML